MIWERERLEGYVISRESSRPWVLYQSSLKDPRCEVEECAGLMYIRYIHVVL